MHRGPEPKTGWGFEDDQAGTNWEGKARARHCDFARTSSESQYFSRKTNASSRWIRLVKFEVKLYWARFQIRQLRRQKEPTPKFWKHRKLCWTASKCKWPPNELQHQTIDFAEKRKQPVLIIFYFNTQCRRSVNSSKKSKEKWKKNFSAFLSQSFHVRLFPFKIIFLLYILTFKF